MAYSRRVQPDVLRVLAEASISTTYAKVGTSFAHSLRMIRFVNNTDGDMFFALTNGTTPASDGTADNFFVPLSSFVLYDFAANGGPQGGFSPLSLGIFTQVWVRYSSAPAKNSVYVEGIYGAGE